MSTICAPHIIIYGMALQATEKFVLSEIAVASATYIFDKSIDSSPKILRL